MENVQVITHSKVFEERTRLAHRLDELDEEINRLSDQGVSVYHLSIEREQTAQALNRVLRLSAHG